MAALSCSSRSSFQSTPFQTAKNKTFFNGKGRNIISAPLSNSYLLLKETVNDVKDV